jgi:hypothetical protein
MAAVQAAITGRGPLRLLSDASAIETAGPLVSTVP